MLHFRLQLEPGGDPRAPGGAVTCALCGHWDHAGPCRWPHLTRTEDEGGCLSVYVEVTCAEAEWPEVARRVRDAIAGGCQAGPDGEVTRWQVFPGAC